MLPSGYHLRSGASSDRALLVKFMHLTYQELFPQQQDFNHLATTVAQYLSPQTPLWWVEPAAQETKTEKVACLWLGNAVEQISGERYSHIFLLYVAPAHRHQGIGTALMETAQQWAKTRGDRQISLQVFSHNQPALNLYHNLGYQTHSLLLLKPLTGQIE